MAAAGVVEAGDMAAGAGGGSRAGLAPVLPPEGGAGGFQRPVCWADSGCRRAGGAVRLRPCAESVSYTHLDVYKRQVQDQAAAYGGDDGLKGTLGGIEIGGDDQVRCV